MLSKINCYYAILNEVEVMSEKNTITQEDILKQLKLSLKVPELLEEITKRKIIIQASENLNIRVDLSELQKASDKFRLDNKLETSQDTYEWIERHWLTVEDFEEIIEFNLITGKLMYSLFFDKVEPYFYENQLDYAGAILYEIILEDQDLALELFYTIQEKEMTFWDVARQYIKDRELRKKGGYLGLVTRKELNPEISAKVFAVTPPHLLHPIITRTGIHLIFVEEIIEPELDNKLRLKIMYELFSEWLEKQSLPIDS